MRCANIARWLPPKQRHDLYTFFQTDIQSIMHIGFQNQIDSKWFLRKRARLSNDSADFFGPAPCYRKHAKTPAIRYCGGKFGASGTCDGRLDDRQLDPEQVADCSSDHKNLTRDPDL